MLAQASEEALNCGAFNNLNEFLVACGGEDNSVNVWDRRMPQGCLNELSFHENQVLQVEWHPTEEQVLMSSSEDGKVYVWNNGLNGDEQGQEDYKDGPPELVFHHLSHQSVIEAISFAPVSP